MQYLTNFNQEPLGTPYTAYYTLDMHNLDIEMGFPLPNLLPGNEEIKSGEIPEGKYISYLYKGPYSQMEQPYNEIFQWIEANGYIKGEVYYEYYLNSSEDVSESELLTRIVIPVK